RRDAWAWDTSFARRRRSFLAIFKERRISPQIDSSTQDQLDLVHLDREVAVTWRSPPLCPLSLPPVSAPSRHAAACIIEWQFTFQPGCPNLADLHLVNAITVD